MLDPHKAAGEAHTGRTIWKFKLMPMEVQAILAPTGAQPLYAGMDAELIPCVWAVVDPTQPQTEYSVLLAFTGRPFPDNVGPEQHLGTFIVDTLVYHVFWGAA